MKFNFQDFEPQIFTVDVRFEHTRGSGGENSVSTNDRPFIIQKITHQLVNPQPDATNPDVSIQALQDGLYRINWSLYNQKRYFQGPVPMADAAFGSVRHGVWIPLPVPVAIEKNRTLKVNITNELERDPAVRAYTVQVQFHGLEDISPQVEGR